jgi:5-methylcytosine-specific restriction endonuclease McrA
MWQNQTPTKKNTLKEQGFYHTREWRHLRVAALRRDHNLCQHCLQAGKVRIATEVHHIKALEDYP